MAQPKPLTQPVVQPDGGELFVPSVEVGRGFSVGSASVADTLPSPFTNATELSVIQLGGAYEATITFEENRIRSEDKKHLNMDAAVGVAFTGGSVNVHASYDRSTDIERLHSSLRAKMLFVWQVGTETLPQGPIEKGLKLTTLADKYLKSPDKFEENYGTHYVELIYYGFVRVLEFSVESEETQDDEKIKKAVDAAVVYAQANLTAKAQDDSEVKKSMSGLKETARNAINLSHKSAP